MLEFWNADDLPRPKRQQPEPMVVSRIELERCPEGPVLDTRQPSAEVDAHFEDWYNPLAAPHRRTPSHIYVVQTPEGKVLEYDRDRAGGGWPEGDRCLLTGEATWQDYEVQARVCMTGQFTTVSADDPDFARPVAGLVFRLMDLRRYYFLTLEKTNRLVLYRRDDDVWTELAATRATTSPFIYSDLRAVVQGNRIRCHLNGEELFAVTDYHYPQGMTGVRFNVQARIDGITVRMTPSHREHNRRRASQAVAELKELQARLPVAHWRESITVPEGASVDRILGSGDETKWLALWDEEANPNQRVMRKGSRIALLDRQGREIWRTDINIPDPYHNIAVGEPDEDGHIVIGLITERELVLLDGESGDRVAARELPSVPERSRVGFTPLVACNVRGTPAPRDFVLRDARLPGNSGGTVWVYSDGLELLWTADARPRLGHACGIAPIDLDGDGRDALLAGGTMFGPDGDILWIMEGFQEVEEIYQGHHIDEVVVGNFSDDAELDPVAFIIGSSAGVYVLDACTGAIIDVHRQGHAQGCHAGRFRPDLPGIQVMAGCRWGNYGVMACYSGRGERLVRFQPDFLSENGLPVNWTGDGQEHLLITSTSESAGLYDGWGRRVLPLNNLETPDGVLDLSIGGVWSRGVWPHNVLGDPRDELVAQVGSKLHIFAAGDELPAGRVYAPSRRFRVSVPGWSEWDGA